MIAPVKGDASVPAPHILFGRSRELVKASDLLDWWTQWENLCLPLLVCAHQRQ